MNNPGPKPKGIDIAGLTERDIGRAVVYRTAPMFETEEGVITSFNSSNVFVRYGAGKHSQATSPEDLDWVGG